MYQRWSPRARPWPLRRPRGHILNSLPWPRRSSPWPRVLCPRLHLCCVQQLVASNFVKNRIEKTSNVDNVRTLLFLFPSLSCLSMLFQNQFFFSKPRWGPHARPQGHKEGHGTPEPRVATELMGVLQGGAEKHAIRILNLSYWAMLSWLYLWLE